MRSSEGTVMGTHIVCSVFRRGVIVKGRGAWGLGRRDPNSIARAGTTLIRFLPKPQAPRPKALLAGGGARYQVSPIHSYSGANYDPACASNRRGALLLQMSMTGREVDVLRRIEFGTMVWHDPLSARPLAAEAPQCLGDPSRRPQIAPAA